MTNAPHLLNEDRPEFERILDEALRSAEDRPELAGIGERLNAEQLRTMATSAAALLTAAAAAEYGHYVRTREQSRDEVAAAQSAGARGGEGAGGGAGASAMVLVLAPVLAATAMLIFLLVGWVLKALDPEPALAETILTAGWLFGGLTAVAILLAAVGLLVTAVRNSSTEVSADLAAGVPEELSRAHEAWRNALLERGIMPFLRDALADPTLGPGVTPPGAAPTRHPATRPPGHVSPGFTGPGYTGPGFTGPDFGGPDFEGPTGEPPRTGRDPDDTP
ncbi:hypothetical protein ACN20G_12175 [Streptomyces sp. BI20]|uniref:hypothetical protein n=1 Tax=Streptomyces sp. BI20 TaxID=3403460 RepID=UPI003C7346F8